MRIAIVCPYDLGRYGGVQDQALNLSAWLADEGHEAWVVGPGPTQEGVVSVGGSVVINANGSSTPIALSPRAVGRVVDAVSTADVVHIHEPLMPVVSLTATFRVDAPSVGTFHAAAPRWVRSGYRKLFGATGGRIGKLDVVTAVSPVAGVSLAASVRHRIIGNGIDVGEYRQADKIEGRVTFLGRDDPRKGLDVFEAAAAAIARDHPGATFVVAGTNLEDRRGPIEYVGRPSEDEKRRLLEESDVFVAPHRRGESFGMVIAEGMAAGCAVVASALPAFAHVLGDAGTLVPPGDAASITAAVGRLLTDPERKQELQAAGRERVRRFDRAAIVAQYLEAYEDAILG